MMLEPAEAEVLALEATSFARALMDPAAQERYLRLGSAANEGSIPEELVAPLQTMLELIFERGQPSNRAVLQAQCQRYTRPEGSDTHRLVFGLLERGNLLLAVLTPHYLATWGL